MTVIPYIRRTPSPRPLRIPTPGPATPCATQANGVGWALLQGLARRVEDERHASIPNLSRVRISRVCDGDTNAELLFDSKIDRALAVCGGLLWCVLVWQEDLCYFKGEKPETIQRYKGTYRERRLSQLWFLPQWGPTSNIVPSSAASSLTIET
jgi:hypothetical protein